MSASAKLFFLALTAISIVGANAETRKFSADSYSLMHDAEWIYSVQNAPDGSKMHMFSDKEGRRSISYCHTTQSPLNPSLSPTASRMSAADRVKFFTRSNSDLLFSIYSNLPSAPGFQHIHSGPSVVGKDTPGFMADFYFSNHQGFVYKTRAHYTFWEKAQLSIWCQTAARSRGDADAGFSKSLPDFQRFIASVQIRP